MRAETRRGSCSASTTLSTPSSMLLSLCPPDSWRLARGRGGSPDDSTANLMFQPFGRWLVVAVGAAIFGAGLYRFYEVYKADFSDELKTGDTSLWEEVNAARRTSRLRRQGRSLRDDRRLPGPGCSPGRSGRGQGSGRRFRDPGAPAFRTVYPERRRGGARRPRRLHVRYGPVPSDRAGLTPAVPR